MSGSEIARRFDSPMLSKIAAQKAAETAKNQAALAAVARLKASRTAGPSPATRSAGAGKSGLARNCPPGGVEDSPDRVFAYAEQETKLVPFSEHGARGPVEDDLPRYQIGAWMIVEGRGDNGIKGVERFGE